MKDNITKDIREKLQDFKIDPPEDSWDFIHSNLFHENKKRIIAWKKWMTIAAAFAVPIFLAITLFLSTPKPTPKLTKQISTIDTIKKKKAERSSPSIHMAEVDILPKNQVQKKLYASSITKTKKSKSSKKQTENRNIENKVKDDFSSKLKEESPLFTENKTKKQESPKETKTNSFKRIQNDIIKEEKFMQLTQNKTTSSKLRISSYAGVSTINSFAGNNLISDEMNQLSVDNKSAISYGSMASIKLNNKLYLRSGVGIINMKQETYNVPLATSRAINYAEYNMEARSNIYVDVPRSDMLSSPKEKEITGNVAMLRKDISYELQFIEIPLELEYNLLNIKKFDIYTTTGLSTLFRNKNEIYLENKQSLAKSTNINALSFSANLGVKLNYSISNDISITVEPQMKYLINTISNNSDVKPYTLGINFGLSWNLPTP